MAIRRPATLLAFLIDRLASDPARSSSATASTGRGRGMALAVPPLVAARTDSGGFAKVAAPLKLLEFIPQPATQPRPPRILARGEFLTTPLAEACPRPCARAFDAAARLLPASCGV